MGRKSEESNTSSPLDVLVSSMGAEMPGLTCSRGEVVPPKGPVLGSRRDRSASSRRGYMSRVRYEADWGRAALLGLSMDLLRLFCAAVVLMGLVTPAELRFLLPDLDDGLYTQGAPFARHRPHNGLALLHLTLAMRQLSQDSLSLGALGGVRGRSDWSGMANYWVKEMAPK